MERMTPRFHTPQSTLCLQQPAIPETLSFDVGGVGDKDPLIGCTKQGRAVTMKKFTAATIAKMTRKSLFSKTICIPAALKGGSLFCTFAFVAASSQSYESNCDAAHVQPLRDPEIATVIREEVNRTVTQKVKEIVELARKLLVYLQRIFAYAVCGGPVVCIGTTAYIMGGVDPLFEDLVWDYCMWSIQLLGPTFVKLAQWASTRPDLYPPALIKRLESLQDDVKVNYSMDTVERTLTEAFGPNWKDTIEVEGQPLGAGCVAQVFKGTLKDTTKKSSQKVAIKLIHPHVEKMIQTDMELLGFFANFIDRFPSLEILSLGETCREYCNMMNAQLDLRLEASNLSEFSAKFANDPWAAFPTPIEGFVTRNVLIETLMEGSSIANFMRMQPDKGEGIEDKVTPLKLKLSDLGCRSVIKMIFFDNLVHGDMHPGNILVQFNAKGDPRLVFLDAGIVYSSKTEESYKNLVEICFALMKHDGYTAGKLMIDNQKRSKKEDAEAFCVGVQQIIDESEEHLYFEHIGEYVGRICNLARVHSVKLDPSYFQIAMALKVMEGVALSLNEDLELVSKCIPLIVKAKALRAIGITRFPSPGDY